MADGLLNWYKGELKKEGKDVSRFTDDQLTYEIGRKLEAKGGIQAVEEYPNFAKQYKKINNDLRAKRLGRDGFFGPIKEIGAGIGQGIDETQAMIQGGIGAGFKTVGLDSAGDSMMDAAMANLKESQVNAPTIQSYQDVTGIGDAVRYLSGGLGRVLPSAGTMLATGGVTGFAGKKVLEKSVVGPALRKALKDNATKSIAKEGLKKEAFDQLSPDAQDIVKAYAYGVSQNVGVGTASGTMGIGEVYTSLHPYTQLDPQDKDYLTDGEALRTSWMFGTAIGSLDSILPSMVGKSVQGKFFKGKSPDAVDLAKADNFTKRSILALTAKGMAVEAGTEATQEYLNVVADKFAHDEKSPFDLSQFTDQEIATMIDAGILGSIGGGVFGVAGGIIENWQTDRKVEQVTKEKVEKARDAEKKVKDILDKLAGETDVVPTFTKGDSVFDVADGKEYEFVSATGEVAKVKDGEETKEVSIRNLTQAVKKQEEQAETTEEKTEDVQDVVQSFQDDIPENKSEWETTKENKRGREVQTSKIKVWDEEGRPYEIVVKWYDGEFQSATGYNLDEEGSGERRGSTDLTDGLNKVVKDKLKAGDLSALDELRANANMFTSPDGGAKREAKKQKALKEVRSKQEKRAEVLAKFEEARNVQLELENDEGKVITISAPQSRVLEIVGDSNYKQEISKDDYKTWADEFYAPGQQPSKKEMSATYDQAFEARYPKLLKELQETKDTAEEAKKTGTEKKEKDETFLRNDVIADKNLKTGAKVTLNQRGRLQANSALGLDVDQARQEFEITEIDDQGFVKIKGGGVTLKQGVHPRNFNKFVEKAPPKPKVATPAPTPLTPPEPVVEEIDGSELTEIPQPKEGKYVITLESGVNKPFEITADGQLMLASKGFQMEEGLSLADAIVKKFEKAGEGAKLYEIKSLSVPGAKNIGVTFDGIAINYDINSENKSQVISREASENNGLWKYGTGDNKGETRIDTGTNQRQVQFIESAVFEDTPSVGSFTEKLDSLYGDKKKYDKRELALDPRPAGSTMVVAIRHNPSGTIIVRSIVNKEGEIYNISSRTKKGLDLRDSSINITYKELLGFENFTVLQIARFNAARGKFRDQFENISEYEAWLESIPKAKELEGVSGMTQSKLNDAYAAYKKYKEGLSLTDKDTKLLEDTFEYTLDEDGNAVFDKESDPVVSYSLRYFTPTDSKYGRLKLVAIVDEIEGQYLKDATNASQLYDRLPVEEKKDFSYFPKVIKELNSAIKSLTDESGNQLIDNRSVTNFAKLVLKAVYQSGKTDVIEETKRGQGGISLDQSIKNQDGEGLSVGDTIPEEENVSHLEKQSPEMVDFPADRAEEIFKVFFPQGSREQLNILHQYAQGLSPDESDVGVLMDTNRNIKYSEDNTPASVQESMTPDALHYYGEQNGAEPYWAFLQWLSNFPKLPDVLSKTIEQDANQDTIPTESDIDFQKEVLAEYNRLGKEIDIKNAVNQATRELFEVSYGIEANDPSPTSQSNAQSFSGVEKGIEKAYFHALNTAQKRNANYEVEDFIIQILDIFDKDTSSELTSRIMEAIEAEGNEIDTNAKLKSLFSEVLGDELGDRFTAVFDSLSDSALEIFGSKAGGIVMFGNLTAGGSVFHLNISQFKEENTSAGVGNRGGGNVPLHNPINKSIGSADPTPGKKFIGGKVDPLNESEEAAKVLSQENDNGPAMTKVFDISPEQMSEIKERNRAIIDEVLDGYDLGGAAALENINNEEFVSEEAEQFIEEIINVLDEGMKAALNEGRDIKVDVAELPQPRQGITRAQFNPDTNIITIDPRFYLGEKDTSITPYEITGDRNRDILITVFIHEAWHATLDTPIDVHEKALIKGETTKYADTYDLMQQVIKELGVLDKGNQYGLLNEDAVVESLNRIWTRPDFARWANGQKLSGELQKKIDAHTKTSSGSILDALHALYIKLLELMDISIVEGNSFDSLIRLSKKMQEVHNPTAVRTMSDANNPAILEGGGTVTEAGKIGVDKKQLMALLGPTMYEKPIAQVAVKELLQNAFDAVKTRINLTDNKKSGKIDIEVDASSRTIKLTDDGMGMTPDIVKNAFLNIGGTNKEGLDLGERSGGFGLAKVQFLLGSDYVKVSTVRDGLKTELNATADELYNDNFEISTSKTSEPNGTSVEVKIPKEYTTATGETKNISFFWSDNDIEALQKPLIGNVDVSLKYKEYESQESVETKVVEIGNNSKLPPLFTNVTFDWGTAEVYISEEKSDSRYPKHEILSSGVYQFDKRFTLDPKNDWGDPIPYEIIVNIKPNVATNAEQYPFNNQREDFKPTIKEDIKSLKFYLAKFASGEAEKEAKQRFEDIIGLPNIDPDKVLTEEERSKIFAEIADLSESNEGVEKDPENEWQDLRQSIIITQDGITDKNNKQLFSKEEFESSFEAEQEIKEQPKMDIGKFDAAQPQYHNNTTFDYTKIEGALEFFSDLGSVVHNLVRFVGKNFYGYEQLKSSQSAKYFAGISIDKKYAGVHVNKPFKGIFINPLAFSSRNKEGAMGVMLHAALHEIAHTNQKNEGAKFTTELAVVHQKMYELERMGYYEGLFRSVFTKHFDTYKKLLKEYDKLSTKNRAESFKGDEIKGSEDRVPGGDASGQRKQPQFSERGSQGDKESTQEGADQTGEVIASKFIFAPDSVRANTRTHIRLEADGDGYIVTNLEDKPVRLSLEEAKKIVRFKDNPSRVGRIKLKGDGSELTKTEEEGGKFVEYVRVIENGNDFWVKRDDIEAYDRRDTIKQMSDQLTFDFDKSEEQVEKEKKLAPEVVDTPKYTPQQLTSVVAKNISWGGDNDGIHRSIARKISNGTGIPYNRVLNEIYVLNRMHEDTPIRYRTKFMDEAERGYKRYYGRRKFMVDELDPNIEDRSDEIVGKKPVIEQNKRDTIRMEAASINEVSGVIAQAIQVVREKMGIEENITADSILKVLGVKGTRPGRRMQALLKLSGGDETMKTTTTGSMRNNENMYQEANERSLQKLDAIINNATKEKTGALELIKQNEEKIEENSEIKPDSSFIFNLAKTGDKLRKEIVKQLENTATALNNNEEYANDPILKAFEKLKGENESADIEQLERASKISGKYITDLIDKVINSGGDITLEKLYDNISLDIKDDRAVVLAAVLTSKAGIEQIAFRMLARSGNVNQKRTTIEKLVGIYKANEMQLAQIKRVVGSDEYRATYDVPFIKGANNPEYIIINEFIARREEIFKRQKQNKELAKRIQGIDALTSVVAQASERKKILLRHNPASYIMDGTEMPVMKREGDEYVMDKITVRLNNSLKPADYEEFKKALIANRQYLMDPNLVKDQVDENGYALFGSTTYNYVKSMTLKGEALTVFREHEEAVRGLKTWWLKSNPDLWKRFGTEGREIARMLISADVASREAMPRFRTVSRKYNRALLTAAREMGYTTTNKTFGVPTQEVDTNGFVDHVIDPLLKWNEDNPSFGSLTRKEFYTKAYDYAKNLIGDRRPSPEARNALYELLDNYDNITTMLKQLGEKHGLYVQNDRRKVMNYFTGKMEPVSRAPIRRGYMTVPRRFKPKFVADLVRRMADNKGWADRDSELSKAQLAEYVSGSATDEEKNALMDQWIDTRIDEDVLEDFIYPYIKNTSPRHLLTTVDGTAISTVEMTDAWAKSEGRGAERFKSWIDGLYESLSHKKDRSDYTAFKLKVINAFNGRFFQMHSALELSGKSNDNKAYAMAHALMDSRAQDAIIPIEFLEYETFDEISINRQVEQIIGHAIYGRSGEKLNTMIDNLGNSLEGRVGRLEKEVQRVGGKMAEGLEPMLTQTQKNEIINNIGEEQFDSLIRAVRNWSNFSKAKDQLGKYFESDSGPTQDEKFAFDALGTMSFLILQQVKSGLTNILSLGDQMVVYKGLNKYSIKATANSASNLMGQFFGGLLENLGVQLKGNEYAEQLMPTFFNTEENSVGFMDYTLNIGARGAKKASKLETFKLDGLRRLRQAMTYSPVSEGRRTAPVGLRTLFLHPFTYLSNLTNHSLAVSAARMVDGMVREVTAFLEANPNLPQDYEVTADDLGLKSGVTGSSKELFEYINNSLEERTMGTLTNLSRKYIDRKARGDMRVLTKDQVLAVGTIALHKVAMEGGFSSKPSFMYTNQLARAGAPLQAWSFAKVDQMMEQMRDQEKGNYQAAAMIRLLATTAFWLVPVGMMFTFGMDEYDEEVLGKASALRPAPLSTAIPIFGPFMEGDPKGNTLAMFERLGRAGNIGGVAFDFLANMMADIDPYNHNRGFSLDTRILAMAQILNLKDALKNIIHSGTFDYQLVQRPLMYTMGMNGYLQTHQAITNLFDIDSDERRVSNMIGNRNKVRAALANLGIERAPMTGGSFRATRFSVQIRRMERAAYANDSEEFRDAYREAVEASAERGDEDPEKSVLQAFKRRNLRSGISKYKLSDDEWRKVQGVFTDEHASSLRHAMGMHEKFVNILESSSAVLPTPVMDSTSTNPVPFVAPISYNEIIRRSLQL